MSRAARPPPGNGFGSRAGFCRRAVPRGKSGVVETQQRDHVAYIRLVPDRSRRGTGLAGEDRVMRYPALLVELVPERPREAEVGCVVAVHVSDLAAPELEGELADLAPVHLDAGPGGDLVGDLLARIPSCAHRSL